MFLMISANSMLVESTRRCIMLIYIGWIIILDKQKTFQYTEVLFVLERKQLTFQLFHRIIYWGMDKE